MIINWLSLYSIYKVEFIMIGLNVTKLMKKNKNSIIKNRKRTKKKKKMKHLTLLSLRVKGQKPHPFCEKYGSVESYLTNIKPNTQRFAQFDMHVNIDLEGRWRRLFDMIGRPLKLGRWWRRRSCDSSTWWRWWKRFSVVARRQWVMRLFDRRRVGIDDGREAERED